MKNVKYSCHFQWLNTEHWSLNNIAVRHTRSCISSSQLLFITKQTRRWSVRFIHHSVIETNLAARSHDPIMRIKLNCEQVFLFARSFWGEYIGKGSIFSNSRRRKKLLCFNYYYYFYLVCFWQKNYFDKKQIDYYRLSDDLHLHLLPNYNYCFGFCTEIESEYAVQTEGKEKRKTVKTNAIRQTSLRWQWVRTTIMIPV